MFGKLYLVATPIGNLKDITFRAIEVLKEVDIIAAEDTRNTIKLLNHYEIKKQMTSYHEHNKFEKGKELIGYLLEGKSIALVTDAGMPAISDPGEDLVKACYNEGIEVSVIPGASAVVSAVAISGLSTRRFIFEAFLPSEKKERKNVLEKLREETSTIILYESPHRLTKTLEELRDYLGEDRKISIIREITKKHEEVLRVTILEAINYYLSENPRGEFVLVIEGANPKQKFQNELEEWKKISIKEHVKLYEDRGISSKDAMKLVAKDRGVSKRDIYNELLK